MAIRLTAINKMRPKVTAGLTAKTRELVKYINERTGLSHSLILMVFLELSQTMLHFNLMGRAIRVEDLGIFSPYISIDGTYETKFRLDSSVKKQLNVEREFTGEVENRKNIGKSPDELVELWNEAHPDDLVLE